MNTYQQLNPQCGRLPAAHNRLNEQQFPPNMNLVVGGFDIWWHKTFAQHTAVIAQASAIMRAHRGVSSGSDPRVSQTH
jgi:hypothetical protein